MYNSHHAIRLPLFWVVITEIKHVFLFQWSWTRKPVFSLTAKRCCQCSCRSLPATAPPPHPTLQALVDDILPSITAVFSYAIGSRKLSANEQFFVGAQTVVRLLQTTQIKQGVSFIAASKVYTSTNKTTIV